MIHYIEPGLSRLGRIRNLVEVDFAFNVSVNKYFVNEISGNCHNLEILNLMCCQGQPFIDDDTTAKLSQMKKLKHLNLNYACEISDAGLTHISGVKSLEKLELVGLAYDKVSEVGSLKLVKYLRNLKYLDLCGNRGIGPALLKKLGPIGLTRQTPLEINLAKTGITSDELFTVRNIGQIKFRIVKTCNVRFRYDRSSFFVGGFIPNFGLGLDYDEFDSDSDPDGDEFDYDGFDDVSDGFDDADDVNVVVDALNPFDESGNWSGEIIVEPPADYDFNFGPL